MTTNQSEKDPWLGGEQLAESEPKVKGSEVSEEAPPDAEQPTPASEPAPATETWRLFVAVPLPQAVRDSMAELCARMEPRLRERVRWTPTANIHVTLQFLGDTDPTRLPELVDVLSQTADSSSAMSIAAGKTGAFPLFRNPKILWIGFDGETHRLEQMQGRVEGGLARLGFEAERRKWTAHATVGRVLRGMNAKQAADLGFAWKRMVGPRNYERFLVTSFALMRSHLRPEGPTYDIVEEFTLGG